MNWAKRKAAAAGLVGLLAVAGAISGCGSGEATGDASSGAVASSVIVKEDALAQYHVYLVREANALVDWSERLQAKITAGQRNEAEYIYTTSRVFFGHLLPAASQFGGLEERINGGRAAGFHRLERGLYRQGTTAELEPVANRLVADLKRLRAAIAAARLRPLQLAEGLEGLMEVVAGRQLAGEEDPVSGTDLRDAAASLEGAERAFQAIRPRLDGLDPRLVANVQTRQVAALERLAERGSLARESMAPLPATDTVLVPYEDLHPGQDETMAEPVEALERLFREASEQLSEP